jgi:SAM-dependent methyltransferase
MKKILRAISQRGVWNAMVAFYDRYWFELRYGLGMRSTGARHQGEAQNGNYKYEPISHRAFHRMMKKINWNFRESTFLDFGCGKGAAILLASRYHFKKYIGVEYSRELADDCVVNIRKYSKKSGKDINHQIICMDATRYGIPPEVNVVYFFNPFNREIMDIVLQNIELSVISNNRKVLLIYFNAQFKDVVEKYGYTTIYSEPVDKVNIWYQHGNYAYVK